MFEKNLKETKKKAHSNKNHDFSYMDHEYIHTTYTTYSTRLGISKSTVIFIDFIYGVHYMITEAKNTHPFRLTQKKK